MERLHAAATPALPPHLPDLPCTFSAFAMCRSLCKDLVVHPRAHLYSSAPPSPPPQLQAARHVAAQPAAAGAGAGGGGRAGRGGRGAVAARAARAARRLLRAARRAARAAADGQRAPRVVTVPGTWVDPAAAERWDWEGRAVRKQRKTCSFTAQGPARPPLLRSAAMFRPRYACPADAARARLHGAALHVRRRQVRARFAFL